MNILFYVCLGIVGMVLLFLFHLAIKKPSKDSSEKPREPWIQDAWDVDDLDRWTDQH